MLIKKLRIIQSYRQPFLKDSTNFIKFKVGFYLLRKSLVCLYRALSVNSIYYISMYKYEDMAEYINLKKRMKQKLINLAVGELVAVTVFWMNFFIFKKLLITAKSLITISFPLFILSFILIQGAVFWCILAKRMSKPGFALKYTGKIYSKLKVLDVILLFVGVLVIILNYSGFLTMLIAFAIWTFAVIEWVNYYKLQLSYSLNTLILLKYIMQRKLRKSKIAKEIDKIY